MTDAPVFKLTINMPAKRHFFHDSHVAAMRIKLADEDVFFRPTTNLRGIDTVRLQPRPRGGFETIIDGSMADQLLAILLRKGSLQRPFFILEQTDNDWISLTNYTADGMPPKLTPCVRVWYPRNKTGQPLPPPMSDEVTERLGEFSLIVRAARQIMTDYEARRPIGRRPYAVIESEQTLTAFALLAREVLPQLDPMQRLLLLRDRLIRTINDFFQEQPAKAASTAHDEVIDKLIDTAIRTVAQAPDGEAPDDQDPDDQDLDDQHPDDQHSVQRSVRPRTLVERTQGVDERLAEAAVVEPALSAVNNRVTAEPVGDRDAPSPASDPLAPPQPRKRGRPPGAKNKKPTKRMLREASRAGRPGYGQPALVLAGEPVPVTDNAAQATTDSHPTCEPVAREPVISAPTVPQAVIEPGSGPSETVAPVSDLPAPVIPTPVIPTPVISAPVVPVPVGRPSVMAANVTPATRTTVPAPVILSPPHPGLNAARPAIAPVSLMPDEAEPDFIEVYPDSDEDSSVADPIEASGPDRNTVVETDYIEDYDGLNEGSTHVMSAEWTVIDDALNEDVGDVRDDVDAEQNDDSVKHRRTVLKNRVWRNKRIAGATTARRR